MRNYFFSISAIIGLLLFISCSNDDFETQSESTNVTSIKSQSRTSYAEVKALAQEYTNTIYTLFDKIEENDFTDEDEVLEFSMSYMENSNNRILDRYGYSGIDYKDFIYNDSININDVSKLEISDIEKYYLTNLYQYHLHQDDKTLIELTDKFIVDIEKHNELESLSFYFALIDVNRDLFSSNPHNFFLSNSTLSSNRDCKREAVMSGAREGAQGMIVGAIRGGISGITIGGGNPLTGGAGAIAGAVTGGLIGFVKGGVKGYLKCKVGL